MIFGISQMIFLLTKVAQNHIKLKKSNFNIEIDNEMIIYIGNFSKPITKLTWLLKYFCQDD